MLSYTKSLSNILFDGAGDQPINTWNQTTTVNGPNKPELSYSNFVVPDRVIAAVSLRKQFFKHLATTVSIFYEGAIDGRFSYTYSTDFNRDGATADLIYIPKNATNPNEIQFVSQTVNGVTYTPAQQAVLFENFILQDKYLRAHRGGYAERNGAQIPWRNQFDVKFLQDLFANIGKNKNTIQFSVDIFNFLNLLNPKLGIRKITSTSYLSSSTNVPILQPVTVTPNSATIPTFRLAPNRLGQINTNSFISNVALASTYYLQFGIRYSFN